MMTPYLTCIPTVTPEGVTARITGTIKDDTGTAIPASALTTLTLTLYLKSDPALICNSRNAVSVLNANGGTVDSSGHLIMILSPADNAAVNPTAGTEVHVAYFVWTYNSGTATGRALVEFTIDNLVNVP